MPFEIWRDDNPARLTLVNVKHTAYRRLERCYFRLKRMMEQDPDEDFDDVVQTVREVLAIGYTQPLRDWTSTMGVDLPRLYRSIRSLSQGYTDGTTSFTELRMIMEELEQHPVTLVQAALERFFMEDAFKGEQLWAGRAPHSFGVRFSSAREQIDASLQATGLTEFCASYSWKDLIRNGIETPLILAGPVKWHQAILRVPPAKRLIIIQPDWHSGSFSQSDLFQTPTGRSIGMGADAVRVDEEIVSLTVWDQPTPEWVQQTDEEEVSDEQTLEPPNAQSEATPDDNVSTTHKIKVFLKGGWRVLDAGRLRVIIDQHKNVKVERIRSAEDLSVGSSFALWEEVSGDDINLDEGAPEGWQKQMENWKQPLRKLRSQPYLLEKRLRELGAGSSATDLNIKNWMQPSNIRVNAPRDLENDFRAVLRYAQIPAERHRYYMNLVSRVRNIHRESGRDAATNRFESAVAHLESTLRAREISDGTELEVNGLTFQICQIQAVGMDFR